MREMAQSWLHETDTSDPDEESDDDMCDEALEALRSILPSGLPLDTSRRGDSAPRGAGAHGDPPARKGGPPARPPPPVPVSPPASAPASREYCLDAKLADGTHLPVGQLVVLSEQDDDIDIPVGAAVACGIVVEESNETDEQLLERLLAETASPDAASRDPVNFDALTVDDNR
jgi:hypothetical protein